MARKARRQTMVARIGQRTMRGPGAFPSSLQYHRRVNATVDQITDELMSIMGQFIDVTPDIMLEAMRPTFQKSQVYVPKLTYALMNSGYLEVTSFRGKPRVEIGYARGNNPPYAAHVHEMVDIPHAAPTRSKFLQAAVQEDLGQIYDRLGNGYKRFMGGGT
jgi:hypothetical protein